MFFLQLPTTSFFTFLYNNQAKIRVCVCVCVQLSGVVLSCLVRNWKQPESFCFSLVLTSLLCCTTKQGEQTSSIAAWKPAWLFSRQKSWCLESGEGYCEQMHFSHCFLSPSPSSLPDRASEQVSVLQLGVRLSELPGGPQLRRVDVSEEHERWTGNYMWSQLGKSRWFFMSYQLHRPVGQRGLLVRVHRGSDQ